MGGRAHVHALVVSLFGAEAGDGQGHGDEAAVGRFWCVKWGVEAREYWGPEEEGAHAGADAVAADYFFGEKREKTGSLGGNLLACEDGGSEGTEISFFGDLLASAVAMVLSSKCRMNNRLVLINSPTTNERTETGF